MHEHLSIFLRFLWRLVKHPKHLYVVNKGWNYNPASFLCCILTVKRQWQVCLCGTVLKTVLLLASLHSMTWKNAGTSLWIKLQYLFLQGTQYLQQDPTQHRSDSRRHLPVHYFSQPVFTALTLSVTFYETVNDEKGIKGDKGSNVQTTLTDEERLDKLYSWGVHW